MDLRRVAETARRNVLFEIGDEGMHKKAWTRVYVKERDSQRGRLYKADDVLKPFATQLPEIRDVERFVERLFASKRVRKSWPRAVCGWSLPRVNDGRGCRNALAHGGSRVTIPRWARTSDVVIHELAHVITYRELGSMVAGHGWQFCSVYLRLVLLFMGREAHDAFKASMKANRVRFAPPRKRAPLSPEARAALVARLKAGKRQQIQVDAA
jgi:putative metallohydrolase (TIGR04338 family)